MTIRDLAAAYPHADNNSHRLINHAIRREVDGGEEVLDAIDQLLKLRRDYRKGVPPTPKELEDVITTLHIARDEMGNVIADRYGIGRKEPS